MRTTCAFVLALILATGCQPGAADSTAASAPLRGTGRLLDSVVHLASGDSVAVQRIGPATTSDGRPTMSVGFYPFHAGTDTARVVATAHALLAALAPAGDSAGRVVMTVERSRGIRLGTTIEFDPTSVAFERARGGRWVRANWPPRRGR